MQVGALSCVTLMHASWSIIMCNSHACDLTPDDDQNVVEKSHNLPSLASKVTSFGYLFSFNKYALCPSYYRPTLLV